MALLDIILERENDCDNEGGFYARVSDAETGSETSLGASTVNETIRDALIWADRKVPFDANASLPQIRKAIKNLDDDIKIYADELNESNYYVDQPNIDYVLNFSQEELNEYTSSIEEISPSGYLKIPHDEEASKWFDRVIFERVKKSASARNFTLQPFIHIESVYEGVIAYRDDKIISVLFDAPYAHEGLHTDNFLDLMQLVNPSIVKDRIKITKEFLTELIRIHNER